MGNSCAAQLLGHRQSSSRLIVTGGGGGGGSGTLLPSSSSFVLSQWAIALRLVRNSQLALSICAAISITTTIDFVCDII